MKDWVLAMVDDLVDEAGKLMYEKLPSRGLDDNDIAKIHSQLRDRLRLSNVSAWLDGILFGIVYPVPYPSQAAADEARDFVIKTRLLAAWASEKITEDNR
jgi:hypothetical protein